jgi:hypothetical protein
MQIPLEFAVLSTISKRHKPAPRELKKSVPDGKTKAKEFAGLYVLPLVGNPLIAVAPSLNEVVMLFTVPVPDQLPPGPTRVRKIPLGPMSDISTSDISSLPLGPAQLA